MEPGPRVAAGTTSPCCVHPQVRNGEEGGVREGEEEVRDGEEEVRGANMS